MTVEPTLVFDGNCGFCTRALGWLRLADRRRIIVTVPLQRPGIAESLGLTPRQCAEALQWRGADGRHAEGAEAIAAAWAVARDTDWPLRVYRRTAGAQRALYGLVALNRHRLPGITPWCARYPNDCG